MSEQGGDVVVLDVPGLGEVHFHRMPGQRGHQGGRVVRPGHAIPHWPDGRELDEPDARTARIYWGEHPELH